MLLASFLIYRQRSDNVLQWDAENQESPAAADRKNAIRSVIGDKWSSEGHMAHKQGVDSLDRPSSMLETPSRFNRRMRLRKEASLARERQKRAHGKASDGKHPCAWQSYNQTLPATVPH